MKINISIFSTFILIALLNQCICDDTYSINEVSKWKKTDITDENKFEVNQMLPISKSLQLTDSKTVVVTFGHDNHSTDKQKLNLQIFILDNDGQVIKSLTEKDTDEYIQINLSLTNVEGEFLFSATSFDLITYITFYDQNLKVTRGVKKEKLGDNKASGINISLGNNLMYIVMLSTNNSQNVNKVNVLDLSDTSTYSIKTTYLSENYLILTFYAYSIQAYSDDTAILYYQATNKKFEGMVIQVMFNSKGEKKSDYPKELEIFVDLQLERQYQIWKSYQLQDKKTATFLAGDNKNSFAIYTYSNKGDEVCSEIIDITGYNAEDFFYGIIGDQGWAYLKDSTNNEGHFVLFNPKKCTMDLKSISDGTGIKDGIAGSFSDYDNEEILMLEFGNLLDHSKQVTMQANLYQIGSVQLDDEESAFVLGFNAMVVILAFLILN